MPDFALPPLYQKWVDNVLRQPIYSEARATCNNCPMCAPQERIAKADYQFNPNTRCCVYHPTVPNFLIGAIISDKDADPEAKEQFTQGALRMDVTPFGIEPTNRARQYYKLIPFGKFEEALCPFYIQRPNSCGIHKYRNARCSTWFCKHERGNVGLRFWLKLDAMLTAAEIELAKYCIGKLEVKIPEEPKDAREKFWGNWMFREPEFFQECWRIVEPLSWEEILSISGEKLNSAVDELIEAFNQLNSNSIPKSLRVGKFTQEDIGDDFVRIWSYHPYNSIDLRKEIVDVLPLFDGRSVEDVLSQIGKETSLQLDDSLLLKLTSYRILIST
ncbi:MAG TPA: hypothetical protein VLH08_04480 [Acidobacteriota bacterium]|nr:hypothetical protein [Acidobacteriota bacterium]